MKAFILAAGNGERLRPLTDNIPKCLVPIQSIPLLRIWFDLCRRNGITEVLINAHSHAPLVKSYVTRNAFGLEVTITEEETLLGSAGTLLNNRNWVGADRDFWVFYGDVLTSANLPAMLKFHRQQKQAATLGVYEVPNPTQCGIVTLDQHQIIRSFVEKPENPGGNLAFAGLLIATPAIFDFIPQRIPADIGFDVLPTMVGRMAAYRISEYLIDIGTPANYQRAQSTWPGLSIAA